MYWEGRSPRAGLLSRAFGGREANEREPKGPTYRRTKNRRGTVVGECTKEPGRAISLVRVDDSSTNVLVVDRDELLRAIPTTERVNRGRSYKELRLST
jgi:hypothetical protein